MKSKQLLLAFVTTILLGQVYSMPLGLCAANDSILIDPRYAGKHNFTGRVVPGYQARMVWLACPAMEALNEIDKELRPQGFRLILYDGYRPRQAVLSFMDWVHRIDDTLAKAEFYPELDKSQLVPLGYIAQHSGHSFGGAIDLGLADLDGKPLDFGSPFDYFGERSHHGAPGLTAQQLSNRERLKKAMLSHGFRSYNKEWWHYQWKNEEIAHGELNDPIRRSDAMADSVLQLIVVQSKSWNDSRGRASLWQRATSSQAWHQVDSSWDVMVGRQGMAWGLSNGLQACRGVNPTKQEGDGRSPAGLFELGTAFGKQKPQDLDWPWLNTKQMICVDDIHSPFYNQIVDSASVQVQSFESMFRNDSLYDLGVLVKSNPRSIPSRGSCIFLHILNPIGHGTAGCTSMRSNQINRLLQWLQRGAHPMLLQLPQDQMGECFPEFR